MIKESLARLLHRPIRIHNRILIDHIYRNHPTGQLEPLKMDLGKVLFLAPHVDDETIGAGAYLLSIDSSQVDLLYVTDSAGSQSSKSRQEVQEERRREAFEVSGLMGLGSVEILPLPNGDLVPHSKSLVENLSRRLVNYDCIFTTSIVDAHQEHRLMALALAQAIRAQDYQGRVVQYEVSNLLPFGLTNRYFAFDQTGLDKKDACYQVFASQSASMDFDVFKQLNLAKGRLVNQKAAEFYLEMAADEFVDLMTLFEDIQMEAIIPYKIGNHRSFYKVGYNEKKAQEAYQALLDRGK